MLVEKIQNDPLGLRLEQLPGAVAAISHHHQLRPILQPGLHDPIVKVLADGQGHQGVLVPVEEIDAVLVPCVAFDRSGGRCGHGAGYYDRFLSQLSPQIPKILIAFDAQEVEETALEPTDVRMDVVVTESGSRPAER